MKKRFQLICAAFLSIPVWSASTQNETIPGVPVSLILTHEDQKKGAVEPFSASELSVEEGKSNRPISSLKAAGANNALLQLLILIDDSARSSFGSQIQTLQQYVNALPATTEVGIGYMRNGTNQMASNFTRNHAAAAKTIRLPFGAGGADVSPYESLAEAVKAWPKSWVERREVIMISSGIEGLGGGFTPDNPYVNAGIREAQKGGVVVFTIYNPSVGSGRAYWRGNWGQNFLSQLADETGGEAYNINMGTPVSLDPFLKDIEERLQHQYILAFTAKAEGKAELQSIRIKSKEGKHSIAAASQVFVPAGK